MIICIIIKITANTSDTGFTMRPYNAATAL